MFFCFNFGMLVPLLVLIRLDMAFKPVSFEVNICTIAWVTMSAEVSLKQRQGKAGEYVQQHCRDGFKTLVFLMKERFKITLRSSRCISHDGLIMVVLKCSILVAHPARFVDQVCAIRSPACCRYPARTILQVSCVVRGLPGARFDLFFVYIFQCWLWPSHIILKHHHIVFSDLIIWCHIVILYQNM